MNRKKGSFLIALLLMVGSGCMSAKSGKPTDSNSYRNEMQALHTAIEANFHDKKSGHYFVDLDPDKRETKFGHWREFSWF